MKFNYKFLLFVHTSENFFDDSYLVQKNTMYKMLIAAFGVINKNNSKRTLLTFKTFQYCLSALIIYESIIYLYLFFFCVKVRAPLDS